MPRRVYTPERDAWLRENFPKMPSCECAEAFNERFGTSCSRQAINVHCCKLGLKKDWSPRSRELVPERAVRRVRWSEEPEKQAFMEENWRLYNPELCAAFERRFGFPLSRPQMTLWRQTNGKILTQSHGGGRPLKPVGSEYVGKDGYVMVKVRERADVPGTRDNWELKHVWVYEQAHGPVPEGHNVYFADGDRNNFDPENLVAVPHRLIGPLNNLKGEGVSWHDAESLKSCMAICELDSKSLDVQGRMPRKCGVCGREFVPDRDYRTNKPIQTCRACLDAGRRARGVRCGGETGICAKCGKEFSKSVRKQRICSDCHPPSVKRGRVQ